MQAKRVEHLMLGNVLPSVLPIVPFPNHHIFNNQPFNNLTLMLTLQSDFLVTVTKCFPRYHLHTYVQCLS